MAIYTEVASGRCSHWHKPQWTAALSPMQTCPDCQSCVRRKWVAAI